MARVRLAGVTRSFGAAEALAEVDLEVRDGEYLVVLGPSGSGKTTLLSMIAGYERPTAGRVEIGGRDVTAVLAADRDVAVVFQSHALYPHLDVRQNIAFPLRRRRVPGPERDRRVDQVAAMLGLSGLLERDPQTLSGGEQQRVAIGRALVREPAVLLLDEPLASLDTALRRRLRGDLARIQRELGTTTVHVTHDQAEALALADRIVVLREGRVEQVGPPAELFDRPATAFVAGFLGDPETALVPGVVTAEGAVATPLGRLPARGRLPAGAAVLAAVRPRDLRVAPGEGGRVEAVRFDGYGRWAQVALTDGDAEEAGPDGGRGVRVVAPLPDGVPAEPGTAVAISYAGGAVPLFDPTIGAALP